ncbi:MAG: metalloprotease TldD, partial [Alphaproteobacteria bacterium]|nr:metalloprotease TldD [Alphaproteobacteria bacterium]
MTAERDIARELLFGRTGLDESRVAAIAAEATTGCDDGEAYLEWRQDETLVLDDGRIRDASFTGGAGFGIRAVLAQSVGYAHSTELSERAMRRAAAAAGQVRRGRTGVLALPP